MQWLQKAESRGLDIVAITDHNTVEGVAHLRAEIERLTWLEANDRLRPQERRDLDEYRRLGERILVLPGFEFTATFGFHILAIFPPETPLRVLELLLLRLNVPVNRLQEGSTEVGATADVLTAYRLIDEAGGLVIAAHANSAHGVAMRGINFGGQTKIAYTQDPHLHALEVTDLDAGGRRSSAKFFDGTKPEYPRRMHCIQGSDAHRLTRDPKDKNRAGIGDRVTEILLSEVSFEAMAAVFNDDDFSVTRPYRPPTEAPYDHVQAAREQGETIIQSFHEGMTLEGGRLNKVLADVVAFANTQGGTVYIGVSAQKKGAPRGVDDSQGSISVLRRELEQAITPSLLCRIDTVQSQGVPILRVSVPHGADKPYAFRQTRIYLRQESETNEAARDEIVRLVTGTRSVTQTPAAVEPVPLAAEKAAVGAPAPAVRPTRAKRVPAPVKPVAEQAAPAVAAEPVGAAKPSRRRRRRTPSPQLPMPEHAPELPAEKPSIQPEQPIVAAIPVAPEPPAALPISEAPVPEAVAEVAGESVVEEIVTESTAPVEPEKPAKRRSRRGRPKTAKPASVEPPGLPASREIIETVERQMVPPQTQAEPSGPEIAAATASPADAAALPEEAPNILEAPAIGVEIASVEERHGTLYFTVRDLRTCGTVRNVTLASARKLWSYAINQCLKNPVEPGKVTWSGDYGLWQVGRRAKKLRYDLVKRQPDGSLRVFYGVTADGMDEPWGRFLKDEDWTE